MASNYKYTNIRFEIKLRVEVTRLSSLFRESINAKLLLRIFHNLHNFLVSNKM